MFGPDERSRMAGSFYRKFPADSNLDEFKYVYRRIRYSNFNLSMQKSLSLSTLCFFLLTLVAPAQDSVRTVELVRKSGSSVEKYHALESNQNVFHGKIEFSLGAVKMISGQYLLNKMDGEWKYFFPNGKLRYWLLFSKGEFIAVKEAYYEDGSPNYAVEHSGQQEIRKILSKNGAVLKAKYYENDILVKTIIYNTISKNRAAEIIPISKKDSLNRVKRNYFNGSIRSCRIEKNKKPWTIEECFDTRGKALNQGTLREGSGLLKTYRDSAVEIVESEINYINGLKEGSAIYFFPNGNVNKRGSFKQDKEVGIWSFFTKKGKLDFTHDYSKNVGFYEPQEKTQEDNIYSISEKLAEYPGGIASMQNFINQRKVYPAEERQNGIQGTVIITFQIGIDGHMYNIKVARGPRGGPGLEKEAISLVSSMPMWTPGTMDCEPEIQDANIPITFLLKN
jgi:TonB family protein